MLEGHDTIIEVSNIMSFVLYTQILKQSVLKPASPGITLTCVLLHPCLDLTLRGEVVSTLNCHAGEPGSIPPPCGSFPQ